jgi:hypothetical protein
MKHISDRQYSAACALAVIAISAIVLAQVVLKQSEQTPFSHHALRVGEYVTNDKIFLSTIAKYKFYLLSLEYDSSDIFPITRHNETFAELGGTSNIKIKGDPFFEKVYTESNMKNAHIHSVLFVLDADAKIHGIHTNMASDEFSDMFKSYPEIIDLQLLTHAF